MKHILMATTALVATASIASAEISMSGFAKIGFIGGNASESQFSQDIDVTFSGSGETSNGMTFGAAIDLDETAVATDQADDQGTSAFISGAFGTLTMGDTDGALDWAMTEAGNMGNGGSIRDTETSHAGYIGAYLDGNEDGQILRYDYSMGAVGFAASVEMDQGGSRTISNAAGTLRNAVTSANGSTAAVTPGADFTDSGDNSMALGLRYNMDLGGGALSLGLGHQTASDRVAYINQNTITTTTADGSVSTVAVADTSATGVSAVYSANGLTLGAAITNYENMAAVNAAIGVAGASATVATGALSGATHTSMGIGLVTGQLTLHMNYGELDYDNATLTDVDGYGVSVSYDMGGAKLQFGMNDLAAGADYSIGLNLAF